MKSRYLLLAAVALMSLVFAQPAVAQPAISPFSVSHSDNPNGPTVSPYLNLLQTNSQGFNSYQTMVKPIIDQNSAIQRQGNALQQLQQQVNTPGGSARSGRSTGHQTFFMNYGHYYRGRGR